MLMVIFAECGKSADLSKRDLTGKIVGGKEAEPNEFPWQVGVTSYPYYHSAFYPSQR